MGWLVDWYEAAVRGDGMLKLTFALCLALVVIGLLLVLSYTWQQVLHLRRREAARSWFNGLLTQQLTLSDPELVVDPTLRLPRPVIHVGAYALPEAPLLPESPVYIDWLAPGSQLAQRRATGGPATPHLYQVEEE